MLSPRRSRGAAESGGMVDGPRQDRVRTMEQPDYRCLAAHLAAKPGRTVTLTFAEIERVVGAPLPDDAYERRGWWVGAGRGPARLLTAARWRVESVDVLGRLATFARDGR